MTTRQRMIDVLEAIAEDDLASAKQRIEAASTALAHLTYEDGPSLPTSTLEDWEREVFNRVMVDPTRTAPEVEVIGGACHCGNGLSVVVDDVVVGVVCRGSGEPAFTHQLEHAVRAAIERATA